MHVNWHLSFSFQNTLKNKTNGIVSHAHDCEMQQTKPANILHVIDQMAGIIKWKLGLQETQKYTKFSILCYRLFVGCKWFLNVPQFLFLHNDLMIAFLVICRNLHFHPFPNDGHMWNRYLVSVVNPIADWLRSKHWTLWKLPSCIGWKGV